MAKLLKFSLIFLTTVLFWNYQDRKDFNEVFDEVEGKLVGPVAATDVQDHLYINDQPWGEFKEELPTASLKSELDSILKPIHANQLKLLNDTIAPITQSKWNRTVNMFKAKALSIDTFLINKNPYEWDTINIKVRQTPVFDVDYKFGVEGHPYVFWISKYDLEGFDAPLDEDTITYETFKAYQTGVDALIGNEERLKITYKKEMSALAKRLNAKRTDFRAPYIIENARGKEVFRDESGFELLAWNETYMTWWDSLFHQIIFWFFVLVWVILALAALGRSSNSHEDTATE
ncbi:hypothetical protein BXY85_2835 [Roseivirga pacifica]|uniref:Uncharacterized protein n=1 Tax=Roseivirga pacifica TaxID=1267423 RepID=A0A1I0R052_9BACT|nr:hypothetical protein [Roseivirga pacifica]RKQ42229.1 hypothetical protein BXY85_2835 [Roseivirga pacifica]SEW33653.1 hypothetical protein SAMN05216290_3037 [Roseivirga pacifica]